MPARPVHQNTERHPWCVAIQNSTGREERRSDVLAARVRGRRAAALALREPGGDDAVVDGERRRLGEPHGEAQPEQRGEAAHQAERERRDATTPSCATPYTMREPKRSMIQPPGRFATA